jgi:TRAP-type transport system small permease protein
VSRADQHKIVPPRRRGLSPEQKDSLSRSGPPPARGSNSPESLTWLGGIALLGAASIETVAVVGRHIGTPLHGSIELVQAAVLVAGSVALIIATLAGSHAQVHLLLDRVSERSRTLLNRTGSLLAALFFLGLLIGNLWIAADLWGGHEVSEIIGVPYAALRICANIALGLVSLLFLRGAIRGNSK